MQDFQRSKKQTLSLPSLYIKSISCFNFIYIISSRGFLTSSVFHIALLSPSIHPSLQLPVHPSKHALSSCLVKKQELDTGGGLEGQRSCQKNVTDVHCVRVFYVPCVGVIDGEEDEGGRGKRKQRRQRSVDMNMNHRTMSSSLLWMYEPRPSTDLSLTRMYVCICVCDCILGPGASGGSSFSWMPGIGSDKV